MREPIFTGSGVAIVTPFRNDQVDLEAFGHLLDFQLENGTDAVVVCGTTGEASTMTHQERMTAIEFCVDRVAGRVPVIAGAGTNSTAATLELSRDVQLTGADALLLVTPYYNKASQQGLIRHYQTVADGVDRPIILYNVPSRTGVTIAPETYGELSRHPNIVGVKEAGGNFSNLQRTLNLCPEDFCIWSGNDDQVVPMMSLGAKGVISVASNIIPEVMVKMSHLCLEGQFEDASKLQIAYMDLIDALFIEVNPIPIKAAMNLMGMEAGSLRLPLCDISHKNLETLRQAMGRMGLL